MDEKFIQILSQLQVLYLEIEKLKETPGTVDPRSVAVALTYLDTAMLWVANARK